MLMEKILLHVEPGVVMKWEDFQAEKPPYSIALDGYVYGKTVFNANGPYANFNHHEGVDRLSTRSTCMQIYFSLVLGLMDAFSINGIPHVNVYVNDADQDVCLSYWLLKNHKFMRSIRWDTPIAKLIVIEDFLDASAGAYSFDHCEQPHALLKKQAWVFEPYTDARKARVLQTMDAHAMQDLIEAVLDRISLFAESKEGRIEFESEFEVIGGGQGWKMIAEKDGCARSQIYATGAKAFVSVCERKDGNYTYAVGKMSPFVNFPIADIFSALNTAEKLTDIANCWGGSDIVGGSPRRTGSTLSPRQVETIINDIIGSSVACSQT